MNIARFIEERGHLRNSQEASEASAGAAVAAGSALLVAVKLVRWSLGARKEKSWLSRRPVAVGRGGEGLYVGQCSNMGLHTYCSLEDIPHLQNFFRMSWYCFVLSCPCVLPFFKFTPLVRSCRTRVRLLLSSMTCPIC